MEVSRFPLGDLISTCLFYYQKYVNITLKNHCQHAELKGTIGLKAGPYLQMTWDNERNEDIKYFCWYISVRNNCL